MLFLIEELYGKYISHCSCFAIFMMVPVVLPILSIISLASVSLIILTLTDHTFCVFSNDAEVQLSITKILHPVYDRL